MKVGQLLKLKDNGILGNNVVLKNDVELLFCKEGNKTWLINPDVLIKLETTEVTLDEENRIVERVCEERFKALLDKHLHKNVYFYKYRNNVEIYVDNQKDFGKEYNEIRDLWINTDKTFEDMVFDIFDEIYKTGMFNDKTVGYYSWGDCHFSENGCIFSYNLDCVHRAMERFIEDSINEQIIYTDIGEYYSPSRIRDYIEYQMETNLFENSIEEYDMDTNLFKNSIKEYAKDKFMYVFSKELLTFIKNCAYGLVSWDGKELKLIKESERMCMYEFEERYSQLKNDIILFPLMNDLINKYKVDPVFFYEINGVYTLSLDLKLIQEDLDYIKNRFNKTDIHDNFTDGKMKVDKDEILIRREK
jgi:hypothetical protein